MKLETKQTLLRVFLRNTDKCRWFSVVETLVDQAHKQGLAGATVLRGIFGLDVNGQLLDSRWWSLAEHVPVIVEFVDEPEIIGRFLAVVERILPEGLVTLQSACVLRYRRSLAADSWMTKCTELAGLFSSSPALPSAEAFPCVRGSEEGQLLRTFLDGSAIWEGELLYRAIVREARELGMPAATVLRAPIGYGAHNCVRAAGLLEPLHRLPIVVEIVDRTPKVGRLLSFLDSVMSQGLATVQGVRILRYGLDDYHIRSQGDSLEEMYHRPG